MTRVPKRWLQGEVGRLLKMMPRIAAKNVHAGYKMYDRAIAPDLRPPRELGNC